mmetsp:Transcript_40470/g.160601  ORF Transcript_40470/g.160601 Transcript_40470/m.160601 type:complete len:342 (-) Transcript_40470:438-1463(-)
MEKLHSESPSSDMLSTLLRRNALSGLVPEFPAGEIEEDWLEPQSAADERLERFRELLDNETYVNVHKLAKEARNGVPEEVRSEVWKYILGVLRPEKSDEISYQQKLQNEYNEFVSHIYDDDEVVRRVVHEVRRLKTLSASTAEFFSREDKSQGKVDENMFVRLISIQLGRARMEIEYHPTMVRLVAPLLHVNRAESDAYYCFDALMKKHEALFTRDGLNRAVTSFLTLLRALEPEFVSHLESEEVEPNSWVPAWMQTLLAGQLARPLLLRLWDTYFASSEGLDLHTYVCLAVVTWMRDELLDQEGPDISESLQSLPSTMFMDQIITRAHNIREDVVGRRLL